MGNLQAIPKSIGQVVHTHSSDRRTVVEGRQAISLLVLISIMRTHCMWSLCSLLSAISPHELKPCLCRERQDCLLGWDWLSREKHLKLVGTFLKKASPLRRKGRSSKIGFVRTHRVQIITTQQPSDRTTGTTLEDRIKIVLQIQPKIKISMKYSTNSVYQYRNTFSITTITTKNPDKPATL